MLCPTAASPSSIIAHGCAAIDRDGGALDVTGLFGAQEQSERCDVFGLAQPAQAVFGGGLLLELFDGFSRRLRALLDQLIEALGLGRAGMDDIDVDAVTFAELRQRLGEIAHRRIDRRADREIGAGRARRAAADIDDKTLRRLEHRPEQPAHAHTAEQFQRITVEPSIVRQVDEISGAGRARRAHQNVAAVEFVLHRVKDLLAAFELAQIRGDGNGRRPAGRGDDLARSGEVFRRGRHDDRPRSRAGELDGDLAANAATAPGDDRDLTGKFVWHCPSCCSWHEPGRADQRRTLLRRAAGPNSLAGNSAMALIRSSEELQFSRSSIVFNK